MTPWFLPVVVLAQFQPAPLRLATPVSARIEVATIEMAQLPRRRLRDPFAEPRNNVSQMEYWARTNKNRVASPPPVCNGNVCAIPVLSQLVP